MCILTQSPSFLLLSHIHMLTNTRSCCNGLWTDILWESREFPSWVKQFLCHPVGRSCGQGLAGREVENENTEANFSPSERMCTLKVLTKGKLPSVSNLKYVIPVFSYWLSLHTSHSVCLSNSTMALKNTEVSGHK